MGITADQVKKLYPGYTGWNDPNAIVADYNATGGAGKGNNPYALGNGSIPQAQVSTPAPTQNTFNVAGATQASTSTPQNSEQALINAMTQKGHTVETAKAAIAGRGYADLAREYLGVGNTGSGAGMGLTAQPSINLPQIYEGLYSQSGIKDLESKYSDMEKQYIEAKGKINDNPFLSEATRVGRVAKIEQLFNERTANIKNDIATKKADIETKLNLQTKQFDIQSQAAQNAISQFNSLLSAGALDNASGQDIANITSATGISSDMIQSAINNRKLANLTTTTQTFDDGVNEGFVVYTLDQQGNVVNEAKKITGPSTKKSTQGQYSTDPLVSAFIAKFMNQPLTATNTPASNQTESGDITKLWFNP